MSQTFDIISIDECLRELPTLGKIVYKQSNTYRFRTLPHMEDPMIKLLLKLLPQIYSETG